MALGGGGDVVRKAAVAGGEFAFAEEIFEFGGGAERPGELEIDRGVCAGWSGGFCGADFG